MNASIAVASLLPFLLPPAGPRLLLASLAFLPLAAGPPGAVVPRDPVLVVRVAAGSLPLPPDRSNVHGVGALLFRLDCSN